MLKLEGVSTAKIILFHQGSTELRRCENCVFFLPVNILTGVACRLLGPHDTLPCVLIMTNSCANMMNSIAKAANSIAKLTNSVANGMNSTAKMTNSPTNGTDSIAKTCKIPNFFYTYF